MLRSRTFFAAIFICILPLIFLGLPDRFVYKLKSVMNQMTVPVLKASHKIFNHVDNFFETFTEIWGYREENLRLKKDLERLQLEVDHLNTASVENERLLKLLQFKHESPWKVIPARVIGRSPSDWNQGLWINRGRLDALKEGMAVVSGEGGVGKIVEVSDEWSRVLLLVDRNCSIGAMVGNTEETGILQGDLTRCILNYLPRDAQSRPGDAVVSSGLSKFFPKGVRIGKIVRVMDDAYGLFQYAEVEPSVNFGKISEVLVIISNENITPESY